MREQINLKNRNTPLPIDFVPTKQDCAVTEEEIEEVQKRFGQIHYRSAIGALIYASSGTRADITHAVSKLAKFSNQPGMKHYKALVWLISYLATHPKRGIRFYHNVEDSPVHKLLHRNKLSTPDNGLLVTFSDASWQDCPDTGRSTTGRISFINGGMVDHASHVPVPVAMSTGEAEYLGAGNACMSAAHLRMLVYDLQFLGTKQHTYENHDQIPPALIVLDSEAAIAMANSDRDTARTRHISRRFHYVRHGVSRQEHVLAWVPTDEQMADLLTKSGNFDHLIKQIYIDL